MPEGPEARQVSSLYGSPSGTLHLDLPRLKDRWLQSATLLVSSLLAVTLLGFVLSLLFRRLGVGPPNSFFAYLAGVWAAWSAISIWGTFGRKRFLEFDGTRLVIGSHLPPFREQLTTIAVSEVSAATVVHRRRNWGAGEACYLEITTAGGARHCCGEGASRTDLEFLADRLSGNKPGSTADA